MGDGVSLWVHVCSVGHLHLHISCSKAVWPTCLVYKPSPASLTTVPCPRVTVGACSESERTQGYNFVVSTLLYLTDLNFQICMMGSWPIGVTRLTETKWDSVATRAWGLCWPPDDQGPLEALCP